MPAIAAIHFLRSYQPKQDSAEYEIPQSEMHLDNEGDVINQYNLNS